MDLMTTVFPVGTQHYLLGGLLLGIAVSLMFVTAGLVTGMSSVFSSTWSFVSSLPYFRQARFLETRQWRLVLAVGLVIGAALFALTHQTQVLTQIGPVQLLIGGFIAGFGARMSNGCTSGHGICGMGSLQPASILAVVIFLVTAMISSRLVLALGGV